MNNPIHDHMDALEMDGPDQVRAWVESQRNLTDREKRRALDFAAQWETSLLHTVLDRVNAAVSESKETASQVARRLDQSRNRIAEIQSAVKKDRMDTADALKELGSLRREVREANAILDAIEQASERAEQTANTAPDTYLADMRRRFPSISRLGTQRLSAAYLRGDEPSPFLTGGRS